MSDALMSTSVLQPIDFAYLEDLAEGDEAVLKSLLQMISNHLGSYPQIIREAFESGDFQKVAEQAHKFKSSVVYLQFRPFTQVLQTMEKGWGKTPSAAELETEISKMDEIVVHTRQQVNDKIASLQS